MSAPNIAPITNSTNLPTNYVNLFNDTLATACFPINAVYYTGDVTSIVPTKGAVYILGTGATNGTPGTLITYTDTTPSSIQVWDCPIGTVVAGYVKTTNDWVLNQFKDGSIVRMTGAATLTVPVFKGRVSIATPISITLSTTLTVVGAVATLSEGFHQIYSDGTFLYLP